jgi:hypothetical protein
VFTIFFKGYKDNRISHSILGHITAAFDDHPNREKFDVRGEINFPNVEFEFNKVPL